MNQNTGREVSLREILVSELCASGWNEADAQKVTEHMDWQMNRPEVIEELTQESRRVLMGTLNLYSVVVCLDGIATKARVAGDYRAAAIATAKLADLLPLVAKP